MTEPARPSPPAAGPCALSGRRVAARFAWALAGFASAALAQVASAPASGAADPAAGAMAFAQCADCHSTKAGDGVGPGLQGIVGRRAGSHAGFHYSAAMAKSAFAWDAHALDAFLAHPQHVVPGTSMDFPGIDDPAERANVIAYLATLH